MKYWLKTLLLMFLVCPFVYAQGQPLSEDKLEEQHIFQSFEEALKMPEEVYRLFLCNTKPSAAPAELTKFKYLQEFYVDETQVKNYVSELAQLPNLQKLFVLVSTWKEAEKNKIVADFPKIKIIFDF